MPVGVWRRWAMTARRDRAFWAIVGIGAALALAALVGGNLWDRLGGDDAAKRADGGGAGDRGGDAGTGVGGDVRGGGDVRHSGGGAVNAAVAAGGAVADGGERDDD